MNPSPADPDSQTARCPRCQVVLPADAPAGLCPACLVSAHFGTEAEVTEPATTSSPAPTIDEIAPHFPQLEILSCLGRGGMGVVYRARQKSLGREVALKLLAPERGADPAFAGRFAREAHALARLDHPHIVTIYDFGQAGGHFYLLMEYVDGVTLRQLVQGGRIAAREALAIVPQICDALQFAHDHGVVHRDIKPENILLDRRGWVKVADFGLAKLVGADAESGDGGAPGVSGGGSTGPADLTAAGHIMGTPRYMAPEQRERPSEVDHRADIYALGVVLYQMLTGELPGEKQLQPPSRRVRVDVRLDEIVLRALENDPERRYASATEFKTRLETLGADSAAAATGVSSDASAGDMPAREGVRPPSVPPTEPTLDEVRRVALEKLKPAATALIVTSALNLVGLFLGLIFGVGMSLFLSVATVAAVGVKNLISPTWMFLVAPIEVAGAPTWLMVCVAVLWLGLLAATNIFIIISARRMMTGRSPCRARTAAIIAVVLGFLGQLTAAGQGAVSFFVLWSVLQLGAGVWAWVLLRDPASRLAFDADVLTDSASAAEGVATKPAPASASMPSPTNVASGRAKDEMIRRRLRAPAAGLLIASALQLLVVGAALLLYLFFTDYRLEGTKGILELSAPSLRYHISKTPSYGPPGWYALAPVALGAGLFFAAITFFAAFAMRRLRCHGLAVCGAVLAIITLQGAGLGVILGVWALVVLWRREVHQAFDGGRPPGRARGLLYAAVAFTGFCLMLLAVVLVGSRQSSLSERAEETRAPAASFESFTHLTDLSFAENGETGLYDLETQSRVVPEGAVVAIADQAAVAGVYFRHNRATNELTFAGLSVDIMSLDHQGDDVWTTFRHPELRAKIGQNLRQPGTLVSVVLTDLSGEFYGRTFLFKTRTGASGLLRVMRVARDPHEVHIEWKFFADTPPVRLVHADASLTSDLDAAPPSRSSEEPPAGD